MLSFSKNFSVSWLWIGRWHLDACYDNYGIERRVSSGRGSEPNLKQHSRFLVKGLCCGHRFGEKDLTLASYYFLNPWVRNFTAIGIYVSALRYSNNKARMAKQRPFVQPWPNFNINTARQLPVGFQVSLICKYFACPYVTPIGMCLGPIMCLKFSDASSIAVFSIKHSFQHTYRSIFSLFKDMDLDLAFAGISSFATFTWMAERLSPVPHWDRDL